MNKIKDRNARASSFTIFMLQQKEVTTKFAVTFIVENFGMDIHNAYKYLRGWKKAGLLAQELQQGINILYLNGQELTRGIIK